MQPLEIVNAIIEHGFECYYVGGYVRDSILGIDSYDIDIATNAKPEELIKIFHEISKIELVGKNFQVVMIDDIEVATYRVDNFDSSGNFISASPVSSLKEDLARRDLTINAMAMHPITGEIIDPYNGREDLKHGIIRFVGNPYKRILEDPVRMLRACRFLALINRARFERETFESIRKQAHRLKNVPVERIRLEIIKTMKAKNAGNFFRALVNTGLMQYVFPKMLDTVNHYGGVHHNEPIFEHCVMACDCIQSDNALLKIAAFLHDIGKPYAWLLSSNGSFKGHDNIGVEFAIEELKRLKFGTDEINYITALIELHMNSLYLETTDKSIRRLIVKFQEKKIDFRDFCKLVIADHDANMKKVKHPETMLDDLINRILEVINQKPAFSIRDLEVNGNDVMEILSIKPGPQVGEILSSLFEAVIEEPELNNRETLLKIIEERK